MKKTLYDIEVANQLVFVRVDFNVPLREEEVSDATRIVEALPTIRYLLENKAKVVLLSHVGKISHKDDESNRSDCAKNDMRFIAPTFERLLGKKIRFHPSTRGFDFASLQAGEVVLMQNTRYEEQEEANGAELVAYWAQYADVYVMDAFGTAHRKHASTYGLPKEMSKQGKATALGFLMQKEVAALSRCIYNVEHPYVAVLGGAKVSSKIKVLNVLLEKVDKVIIGGAMAHTFVAAMGVDVGNARVEVDQFDYARSCLAKAGDKIYLPLDFIVTDSFDHATVVKTSTGLSVEPGFMPLDIGPKTQRYFMEQLKDAKTIFWNGPMGVFENPLFEEGTKFLCQSIAALKDAFTVIGGGDSAAASVQFCSLNSFSHVSTGGGAALEMIENDGHLPGIDIIQEQGEIK